MKKTNISSLLLVVLFLNISFIAVAQKLPKIQQASKWAPTNIKIDAKTSDWNDEFLAYNINNRIYYTIANDDDNLYLVVRACDGYGNEKAIYGITLTIKPPSKKGTRSKGNAAIVFPPLSETRKTEPIRLDSHFIRLLENDTSKSARRKTDSIRLVANKWINESFKEISVIGITEIKEPLISIYNEEGIKVAMQFNNNAQFTYELAIPLKYLNPFMNIGGKLNYNIQMNGIPEYGLGSTSRVPRFPNAPQLMGPDEAYVMYTTDLSGEYTLAKKP